MHVSIWECAMFVDAWKPEVLDLLKHVGGHWELNVGPQEEQCVFLTSELPLQPRHVSAAKPLFT